MDECEGVEACHHSDKPVVSITVVLVWGLKVYHIVDLISTVRTRSASITPTITGQP